MNQLATDLNSAKSFLSSKRRWVQNSMFGGDRRENAKCACVMGACMIATDGRAAPAQRERYNAMEDALTAVLPQGFFALPLFNDDPATTLEDVHALFDRAIERALAGH